MPKVAIYARVSDSKNKEDGERRQEVERQVELLKPHIAEWLENHPDWKDGGVFIDDGKSAFTEDFNSRPNWVKLTGEIRANRIQRVYVEDLTRWSRNIGVGLISLSECGNNGCSVVSVHSGEIDITSVQGWTKNAMLLFLAELESRIQSEKVKSGMNRRKQKESAICGSCNLVHNGRHPQTCLCTVTKACRERREFEKRFGLITKK